MSPTGTAADRPPATDAPPAIAPLPALRDRRVLVVDDAVAVARSTARLLELFGGLPATAHSGAEALERLSTSDFDLLIIDLGLPDLDGAEVLRRARALRPHQRAVLVSGLPPADRPPGGVRFVAKPFAIATLLAAVEAALG